MDNEKIDHAYLSSDTDCCTRQCCGPGRPFEMKILDNMQREVIHLSRPLRCQCCCCPCCLQEIEVQSPPGTVVGYVEQKWALSTEILSLIPKAKMDIYFKCVVLENISPPPLLEPQSNLEFSFQGVNVVSPPPHPGKSFIFSPGWLPLKDHFIENAVALYFYTKLRCPICKKCTKKLSE